MLGTFDSELGRLTVPNTSGLLREVAGVRERNTTTVISRPDHVVALVRLDGEFAEPTTLTIADLVSLDGKVVADPVLQLEMRTVRVHSPGGRWSVSTARIDLSVVLDSQVLPGVHVLKSDSRAVVQEPVATTTTLRKASCKTTKSCSKPSHESGWCRLSGDGPSDGLLLVLDRLLRLTWVWRWGTVLPTGRCVLLRRLTLRWILWLPLWCIPLLLRRVLWLPLWWVGLLLRRVLWLPLWWVPWLLLLRVASLLRWVLWLALRRVLSGLLLVSHDEK